jgi:hypothetical protein
VKEKALALALLCVAACIPVALIAKTFSAPAPSPVFGPGLEPGPAFEAAAFPLELQSRELNAIIRPSGWPCPMPDLDVARTEGCSQTSPYPECKWQVPPESRARGLYKVWWRTPPEELWGSPDLVRLILSALAMYRTEHPDDEIYVGDLDAPLSSHFSHRSGVDADIYLLRWMEWIQVKDAKYEDNMAWRTESSKKVARDKVLHLAKSLAICSSGRLQILYNDAQVIEPFNAWFKSSGYISPLGPAMTAHNDTHHDHFHVRIPGP